MLALLLRLLRPRRISCDTVVTIYNQKSQEHIRKTMGHHRTQWPAYYQEFLSLYKLSRDHATMVDMASRLRLAPCILARNLLKMHEQARGMDEAAATGMVNAYMKSPALIRDDDALKAEVEVCIVSDDVYSPHMDRYRQCAVVGKCDVKLTRN